MAEPWTSKRALLCEGIDDAEFLRAFIKSRNLGKFDVRPVRDLGGVAGNSGFRDALIGSVSVVDFRLVEGIGLISDSDTHYGKTFKTICDQIRKANEDSTVAARFGIPTDPYKAAGGKPRVTVILLPAGNKAGALETLLWSAMCSLAACKNATAEAERACNSLGLLKGTSCWEPAKQAKALVHAGLALSHQKNPGVGLALLFRKYEHLVPLSHGSFNDLEKALKAL